jgi:hypothetical protein
VNETAVRHTNRFLADLIVTMRSAAETARGETVAQCRAEAEAFAQQLRARASDETASMRAAADADVEAIRAWSRTELERIRLETETRIADRGEALETGLREHEASVETQIAHADGLVRDYEYEVADFCGRLVQKNDPAAFAAFASQMPEPPDFGQVAEAEVAVAAEAEATAEGGAEVAVAAEAEATAEGGAEVAVGDSALREMDDRQADESLAGIHGAARTSNAESTRVVVVGLVSVASIATFKRQLSRLPGVHGVGVSSGPTGEFVFTANHSTDTPLGILIPALPGFQARVVSQREGVLNISAHDPETEG